MFGDIFQREAKPSRDTRRHPLSAPNPAFWSQCSLSARLLTAMLATWKGPQLWKDAPHYYFSYYYFWKCLLNSFVFVCLWVCVLLLCVCVVSVTRVWDTGSLRVCRVGADCPTSVDVVFVSFFLCVCLFVSLFSLFYLNPSLNSSLSLSLTVCC